MIKTFLGKFCNSINSEFIQAKDATMSAKQLAALKMRSRQPSATSPLAERCSSPLMELSEDVNFSTLSVFCICNRQVQDILCRSCGYCFVGRMRKRCQVHPSAILLMDSPCCPKCQTEHLMEIGKNNTPRKKSQDDEIEEELEVMRRRRHSSGLVKPEETSETSESWEPAERNKKEDWNNNLYDQENSSETFSLGKVQTPLGSKSPCISSPTVHSAGNIGQRFAGIRTNTSANKSSDSVRRVEVRKRQVLEQWENVSEKMSDLCFGDRH